MKLDINKIKKQMNEARKRLLDLSLRNNLLAFRHSDKSLNQLRIINSDTNFIFSSLINDRNIEILSLPPLDNEPKDEKTSKFMNALELEMLSNTEYINKCKEIEENVDKSNSDKEEELDRWIKNIVREKLGLKSLKDLNNITKTAWAKQNNINPNYDQEQQIEDQANEQDSKKIKSNKIYTLLYPQELRRKITGLKRIIKVDKEEKGANTFYIALGFLEWTEAKNSSIKHYAPLLLLKLEDIKTNDSKSKFFISSAGDPVQINLSLREKMKDFDIKIPDFSEEDTPTDYFSKIDKEIKMQKGWKVRNFVTIGRFIFSRLSMYEDLSFDKWESRFIFANNDDLLNTLFNSKEFSGEFPDLYDIDRDEIVKKVAPILVTSADSSQHSAIIDAMNGENLVIKGPPGTGKSQTITNLIANALYSKKKVLFMSEKKAALDVVYSRLKQAKLGDFCLELHSDKTKITHLRPALETSIDRVVHARKNARALQEYRPKARKLIDEKLKLREYYDTLQKEIGNTKVTLWEALWASKANADIAKEFPNECLNIEIPNIYDKTLEDLEVEKSELDSYENIYNRVNNIIASNKKLVCFKSINVPTSNVEKLLTDISNLIEKINKIEISKELKNSIEISETFSSIEKSKHLLDCLTDLIQNNDILWDLLNKIKNREYIELLESYINNTEDICFSEEKIREVFQSTNDIDGNIELDAINMYKKIYNDEFSLININSRKEKLLREKLFWNNNKKKLLSLVEGLKNNEKDNEISSVYDFIKLSKVFKEVDDSFIPYIKHSEILDPYNALTFEKIRSEIEKLKQQYAELSSIFNMDIVADNVDEVTFALNEIEKSWFFSIFNSNFNKAKEFYNSISLSSKDNKSIKLRNLRNLSSYFSRKSKFENNHFYQQILGCYFNGIDTEINKIIDTNNLYAKITNATSNRCIRSLFNNISSEDFSYIKFDLKSFNISDYDNAFSLLENYAFENNPVEGYEKYIDDVLKTFDTLENLYKQLNTSNCDFSEINSALTGVLELNILLQKNRHLFEQITKKIKIDSDVLSKCNTVKNTIKLKEAILKNSDIIKKEFDYKNIANLNSEIKELHRQSENIKEKTVSIIFDILDADSYDLFNYFNVPGVDDWSFSNAIEILKYIQKEKDFIYNLSALVEAKNNLLSKDYGEIVKYIHDESKSHNNLSQLYEYMYYDQLAKKNIAEYNISLIPNELQDISLDVRKLDAEIINENRELLAEKISDIKIPRGIASNSVKEKTELQLIMHQISGHARAIPLRRFLERAGKAVQALKPCFLMSPISVAQYISSKSIHFDMLIIDEASQMYFEEALGGILRCDQLIVVGDEKQLPPTPFFQKNIGEDDDLDEDDENEVLSILDTCTTRGFSTRDLLWHYRSKDAALISFSNKHFYNDKLNLFPAPVISSDIQGIQYHYVNGIYKASQNEIEANAIVKEVKDFVRKNPDKSLGIGTVNVTQKKLLEQKFEYLSAEDKQFNEYLSRWEGRLESFFVKNLENIQGDERDYIFISTVYGPETPNGRVAQRFGPINSKNGHRRLNVLFTRAKYGLKLFTSMKSDDIVVDERSSFGVQTLKNYLLYAETGRLENGVKSSKACDSKFEEMVKSYVESLGYQVDPQVGVKGFFIDLAVKHPKNNTYYAVGIECDGAPYHSTKSARDRDCIRQQILEDLGWKIYRIWSKDWFFNMDAEKDKLKNYLSEITKSTSMVIRQEEYIDLEEDGSEYIEETNDIEYSDDDTKINKIEPLDIVTYINNETKQEKTVQLVYSATDFSKGLVNIYTPIASAMLGGEKDDVIEVNDNTITILDIKKEGRK